MTGAEKIRVGIVGANPERGWARDAHLDALRALSGFEISAVSARTKSNAERAAVHFGARLAFEDSLALAVSPDVDVVAVTVRVSEHRAIVLAALDAGKHVYCEWPLGRDLVEDREMLAAVRPGSHAAIGLQGLQAPALRAAVELIRSGRIGKPRVLRVFGSAAPWGAQTNEVEEYLQDRTTGATLESIGGGHTLAPVEQLVGKYIELDARCTTFRKQIPVAGTDRTVERTCADHMSITGLHDSGCVSMVEVMGGMPESKTALIELEADEGWLRVSAERPGTCQIASLTIEASVPVLVPSPVAPQLSGPSANVCEAWALFERDLREDIFTLPDFAVAVRLSEVLAAIDRASSSGVRVTL